MKKQRRLRARESKREVQWHSPMAQLERSEPTPKASPENRETLAQVKARFAARHDEMLEKARRNSVKLIGRERL